MSSSWHHVVNKCELGCCNFDYNNTSQITHNRKRDIKHLKNFNIFVKRYLISRF